MFGISVKKKTTPVFTHNRRNALSLTKRSLRTDWLLLLLMVLVIFLCLLFLSWKTFMQVDVTAERVAVLATSRTPDEINRQDLQDLVLDIQQRQARFRQQTDSFTFSTSHTTDLDPVVDLVSTSTATTTDEIDFDLAE